MNNQLLQAVIEGFIDGILIVTEQREVISANQLARQICYAISPECGSLAQVPQPIWQICQSLIKNRSLYSNPSIMIDDVILTAQGSQVRIRVRWIDLSSVGQPCLMVTLEDRVQTAQKMAIAAQEHYGLTRREAEVWFLRQADCTYKAIAEQLHITVDTVKKHIRNINAKRDAYHWAQE